eukprot:m.30285 g.30285  ORF g.30285 m.30285 type:complete len:343 (-) comp13851_c0_seq1:2883-3911(-)
MRRKRGLTLKLVNRERNGSWTKLFNANMKQDKAFMNYPRRMCVRLHDIARIFLNTYYLGFTRCGSFVVSYSTHCRNNQCSTPTWSSDRRAYQTCVLTLWEYFGRRPLTQRYVFDIGNFSAHQHSTPIGVFQYRDNELYVVRENPLVDGRRPRVYQFFMYNYSSQKPKESYIRLTATPYLCNPYPELDPNIDFVHDRSCIINTGDTVVWVEWRLRRPLASTFTCPTESQPVKLKSGMCHVGNGADSDNSSVVHHWSSYFMPWMVVNDALSLGFTTMTDVQQVQQIAHRTPPGCLPLDCSERIAQFKLDDSCNVDRQADSTGYTGYLPLSPLSSGIEHGLAAMQ